MRRIDGRVERCGGPGWITLTALAISIVAFGSHPVAAGAEVDFDRDVSPILAMRCLECHGADASGGLALTNHEGLAKGGDSGEVVAAGKPDESALLERVLAGEMPPPRQGRSQKLPDAEIAALRSWIASGAAWPKGRVVDRDERTSAVRGGRDWWSLRPVARPTPPTPRRADWASNPIDDFILAKLESAGLAPAPQADRRTLIRRASFDLIGLPPTFEEVEAFANDPAPDAYERLVARLLDSPHYGERWARYWLDLARFAETSGYERDQEKPGAWRYRDWVMKSLNDDKPYDRFVLEQVAGDEIPDRDEQSTIATGFLRLGTWNDEPNDPEDYKYERLEDLVHATTTAFLAMTVKCARCHDHKFDPIPQTDYYKIAAAFWPGPIEPRGRELLGGPSREELGYDVLGWTDVTSRPADLHLLKKGERTRPGPVVPPGLLTMIPALDRPIPAPSASSKTTGRRLVLAEWINDPRNPLSARVYVNRLWQHHFDRGLVSTSDNFGFNGGKPSHPELLDWLADEFLRGGRTAKRMHYLMMTSATYQQASIHPDEESNAEKDAQNELLWRGPRRRRDAESLRDAILTVSGRLDLRVGGPSFRPVISAEALEGLSMKGGDVKPSPAEDQSRRSLYMYSRRGLLAPLMTTFDFCDTTLPCGRRDVSVVAPQALALLNGAFAHEQSDAAARLVSAAGGRDARARVRAAWRIILAREPTAPEAEAAVAHLDHQARRLGGDRAEDQALASLCHVLINSNEFAFVD